MQKTFFSLLITTILFLTTASVIFAQRGKHASLSVNTANTIVNEYTTLTANVTAGANTISVASSALNSNNRFLTALQSGDLILIIQIQGATISAADSNQWNPFPSPRDSSWGMINHYYNCGNWEFCEVKSIPTTTSITFDCGLKYDYTAAGKVIVVRVPRYLSLTINSGGSITCDAWNGTIGGICAIEVDKNLVISSGGSINVSGKGFRRGGDYPDNQSTSGANEYASKNATYGAEKGEGIIGYQLEYNIYGGMFCKASPGNGGGGGSSHNGGGGGGANAGDTSLWKAHGNPDNTPAGWTTAWNLQWPGFATSTSSGGGQGGYSFSNSNRDATTTPPGNATWGGENRQVRGGHGGRPLDYSTGKLFLGGGGGAGDGNDASAGRGGNGGALIYITSYGTVSGTGNIISNGNDGENTTGGGLDAGGGGGAGGTIIVNSVDTISGITLTANGGKGGNQSVGVGVIEAEGPGGGGGGGYIAISNGSITRNANGGTYGTTNSAALTEFICNGATRGGAGKNNGTATNFIISAPDISICTGQSAILSATLVGIVPAGTSIIWYDSLIAGNIIGTGSAYTTPVLSVGTYTYYVGTCPGTYHQPIIVNVTTLASIAISPNTTICAGGNTQLNASGGSSYVWSPASSLNNANISNPTASPTITTTYTVTAITSCGTATNSVTITVSPSITPIITGNNLICNGSSATLSASGGASYVWTTGEITSSIIVSPTTTTTYSVSTSGPCSGISSFTVTVIPFITTNITGNTTICAGDATTLSATGGNSYVWNTGATTSSITVSPTSTNTYSVTAMAGSCTGTTSITVSVTPSPKITLATNPASTTICAGDAITITASGGTSYLWNTGATTSSITVSPTTSTTYSVSTQLNSCFADSSINITVISNPQAVISGNGDICVGETATLTASGGVTYLWSTGATTTTINPATAGTYSVIAQIGRCMNTTTKVVTVHSNPTAIAYSDITIAEGQSTTLSASGGISYVWNNNMTGSTITVSPLTTTAYCVAVADVFGCKDTACVTVTVVECKGEPYLPNAFSPNGDGENDELKLYFNFPFCIQSLELVIYNRWGEKIFETNDPDFKWNGIYNKGFLKETDQGNTGVYTYYMRISLVNGNKIDRKGNISIVR